MLDLGDLLDGGEPLRAVAQARVVVQVGQLGAGAPGSFASESRFALGERRDASGEEWCRAPEMSELEAQTSTALQRSAVDQVDRGARCLEGELRKPHGELTGQRRVWGTWGCRKT